MSDAPSTVRPAYYAPQKGMLVRYHDTISGESCAALVAKVHQPGRFDSVINLGYVTEEGLWGGKCDVPYGPGEMGCWYWSHEAS